MSQIRSAEMALDLSRKVDMRAVALLDQIQAKIQDLQALEREVRMLRTQNMLAHRRLECEVIHMGDQDEFEHLPYLRDSIRGLKTSIEAVNRG